MSDRRLRELERAAVRDRTPDSQAVVLLERIRSGWVCPTCVNRCLGEHPGRGTPDCPRAWHHHHDQGCRPGLEGIELTRPPESWDDQVLALALATWSYRRRHDPCPSCGNLLLLDRIKLAASCGDLGARKALGLNPHADPCTKCRGEISLLSYRNAHDTCVCLTNEMQHLDRWVGDLKKWGQYPCVLSAVAAGEAYLPTWESLPASTSEECQEHVGAPPPMGVCSACDEGRGQARDSFVAARSWLKNPSRVREDALLLSAAALTTVLPLPDFARVPGMMIRRWVRSIPWARPSDSAALWSGLPPDIIRKAICDELIHWALDLSPEMTAA